MQLDRGTVCYTGKDDSGNIWINTHTFELQAASADSRLHNFTWNILYQQILQELQIILDIDVEL